MVENNKQLIADLGYNVGKQYSIPPQVDVNIQINRLHQQEQNMKQLILGSIILAA